MECKKEYLGAVGISQISESAVASIAHLRSTYPGFSGTWVEEKEKTFAVHYLAAQNKDQLEEQLKEWLGELPSSIEAAWGKGVVELRPRGLNKGVIVKEVIAENPDRLPVYIGDDVSDETVFRVLGDEGISIKVGSGETEARYRLEGIPAVLSYLKRYLNP